MILNQRLKELRIRDGVTQRDIADRIGVATRNIQNFEYGTARPKLENLISLADFFNVSLDYLVGRSNSPTRIA